MATGVVISTSGDAPPPYMNSYGPPPVQQTPNQVLYIQQQPSACDQRQYRTPYTLIPGIILVIIAVINLGAYIYVGVVTTKFHSIIINAFFFLVVTGILSIVASVKAIRGVVIATLVWTVISVILCFAYIILTSLDLTVAMYFEYQPTITYDSIMLFLTFVAMVADIAVMVLVSRALCCGAPGCNAVGSCQPGMVLAPPPPAGGAPSPQLQHKY